MAYVVTPTEPQAWTLPLVGGKGQALAELVRLEIDVPPVFCVTTSAYRAFIQQPIVADALAAALGHLDERDDMQTIGSVAETLRAQFLAAPIPAAVASEIEAAYADWSDTGADKTAVAVRSSATAEDLPGASFAGQHDSFLFVRGGGAVLEAVRKCWASLWSARAVSYRAKRGIRHHAVAMAVVVQRMVRADVSGVLFTANPLTGDSAQLVIEAVWGLGEGLVSGQVAADEWILAKATGAVVREHTTDKADMVVEDAGRVVRLPVPEAKRRQPTLSRSQLQELRGVALRVEAHFGQPQDIEWAYEAGQLAVLQARPITSTPGQAWAARGSWTRSGLGEWLQRPLSPLFATLALPALNDASDDLLASLLGLHRPSPTWSILNGYYYTRVALSATISTLFIPARLWRILPDLPQKWQESVVPNHLRQIARLRDFTPEKATASAVLDHLDQALHASARCWAWIILTGAAAKLTEGLFRQGYRLIAPQVGLSATTFLSGFPNRSTDADEGLWRVAELAREQAATSADLATRPVTHDWHEALKDWVAEFGHRVFDLDFASETIQDNPALARNLVDSFAEQQTRSPLQRLEQQAAARHAAENRFRQEMERRPVAGRLLPRLLTLAQQYAAIRESRPFFLHLGWPLMRRDLLELGRRLAARKILEQPDDVFFLTAGELRVLAGQLDALGSGSLSTPASPVHERKQAWERQHALVPPDYVSDNPLAQALLRILRDRTGDAGNVTPTLTGIAGSPGKARGSVCIVASPSDFARFRPGQILVAPYTTPAWTPLLALAAGVVTERGGALSHAAIVAREYGVPAVLGISGAIGRLRDGDLIEVDGDAGRVVVAPHHEPGHDAEAGAGKTPARTDSP